MSERSDNALAELLIFTQGTKRWLFTTGADAVVHQSMRFEPLPIERDTVAQTSDVFKNSLSFTFPRGNDFALQFLGFTPDAVTTVTLLRGRYGGAKYETSWKGRVVSAKAGGNTIIIECESVFTSMKRPGLRARYERQCRHALYSKNCGVLSGNHKTQAKITAVNRGIELIYTGATAPEGWYTAGMVQEENGVLRFIAEHKNSTLTLTRPFNGDITGQTVQLFPGCDHLKGTCAGKFDNLENFGGFPFLPAKNPFTSGSIV